MLPLVAGDAGDHLVETARHASDFVGSRGVQPLAQVPGGHGLHHLDGAPQRSQDAAGDHPAAQPEADEGRAAEGEQRGRPPANLLRRGGLVGRGLDRREFDDFVDGLTVGIVLLLHRAAGERPHFRFIPGCDRLAKGTVAAEIRCSNGRIGRGGTARRTISKLRDPERRLDRTILRCETSLSVHRSAGLVENLRN